MSKRLLINTNKCIISKSAYGFKINDEDIEKLIINALPENMEDYKEYPAEVNIGITIYDDPITVRVMGYKKKSPEATIKEEVSENAI